MAFGCKLPGIEPYMFYFGEGPRPELVHRP
jgi:hypothetical protein